MREFTELRHLRVAIDWEVDGLDSPASFGGWNTGRVAHQLFESLIDDDLDTTGLGPTSLVPSLAEQVEVSADGLVYTFQLRSGVRFHDGTPFDAEAAAYNLRRVWDSSFSGYSPVAASYNQVAMQPVTDIKIVAPLSLRITLREQFPEFLRYMTQEDSPGALTFLSPTALALHGPNNTSDRAGGTGPFVFDQRFATPGGSGVRLRRNEDYWGGPAWLERISFIPIPDAGDRAAALRNGDVDLAYGPAPDQLDDLQREGFTVSEGDIPYVWYIAFNMTDGPTVDLAVRRAIAHAIDKTALSRLFGNATRPAAGILPPASPSYDSGFAEPYAFDQERSRQLLADAGFRNGVDIVMIAARAGSGQLDPVRIYAAIAEDLARVGIRAKCHFHDDWVAYCEEWQGGTPKGVAISEMSWGMSADVWAEQVLHSRYSAPIGFNTGRYRSNAADALLDSARITTDARERRNKYLAVQSLVAEDLALLPLLTIQRGLVVHSPRVNNFKFAPQNWHDFRRVELR